MAIDIPEDAGRLLVPLLDWQTLPEIEAVRLTVTLPHAEFMQSREEYERQCWQQLVELQRTLLAIWDNLNNAGTPEREP